MILGRILSLSWAILGSSGGSFGAMLGQPGQPGVILGRLWVYCGCSLVPSWLNLGYIGAKIVFSFLNLVPRWPMLAFEARDVLRVVRRWVYVPGCWVQDAPRLLQNSGRMSQDGANMAQDGFRMPRVASHTLFHLHKRGGANPLKLL